MTIKDHSGSRYIFEHGDWLLKTAGENKLHAQLTLSEQNLDQLSSYTGSSINYSKVTEAEHLGAVEETVHQNLSGLLEGIIQSDASSKYDDSDSEVKGLYLCCYFMVLQENKRKTI